MTSAWPRVAGLMSMNAMVRSSSSTIVAGSSPATILQKMQSGSRAMAAEPNRVRCSPMATDLRHTIEHLTTWERPSASEGERRAAEWIAGELRELGFDADGRGGVARTARTGGRSGSSRRSARRRPAAAAASPARCSARSRRSACGTSAACGAGTGRGGCCPKSLDVERRRPRGRPGRRAHRRARRPPRRRAHRPGLRLHRRALVRADVPRARRARPRLARARWARVRRRRCSSRSARCSGSTASAGSGRSSRSARRRRWPTSALRDVVPGANDNLTAVAAMLEVARAAGRRARERRARPARLDRLGGVVRGGHGRRSSRATSTSCRARAPTSSCSTPSARRG